MPEEKQGEEIAQKLLNDFVEFFKQKGNDELKKQVTYKVGRMLKTQFGCPTCVRREEEIKKLFMSLDVAKIQFAQNTL